MTISDGFIKTALSALLAVMTFLPVRSQSSGGIEIRQDSIRSARMDSIYRSLNDTAVWEREKWRDIEREKLEQIERNAASWEPEPRRAVWFSLLFPGGGQIYNRKYWKLPVVYGGYVGCIYALTWNQSTYMDYQNAYVDIMDDDPDTKSYEDFLPPHYEIDTSMEDWLKDVFKQRKNKYRRYRDLSIFAFAGMYLVAAIDAYVDAELSHFDISPDLSMRVEPNIMIDHKGAPTAGFSLAVNF